MESFRSPAIFCIFVPEEQDTLRSVTAGHRETVNTSLPHVVKYIHSLFRTYTGAEVRTGIIGQVSSQDTVENAVRSKVEQRWAGIK